MFSENAMDRKYDELDELTAELNQYVHEAACEGTAIHVVERGIRARVRNLGRHVLIPSYEPLSAEVGGGCWRMR